jgi:prepilin-type processing-associated H-X9-DG protein
MGPNVSRRIDDIRDGATNTILLTELRIGVTDRDRRGTWAMGVAGASAVFAHASGGDANGPNVCAAESDDIKGCNYLEANDPGVAAMVARCMGCNGGSASNQAAPRGPHQGGVMIALADGSIRMINDFIELGTSPGPNMAVWDRLNAASDGQVLDANAY